MCFEIISWFTCGHPHSFYTYCVLCPYNSDKDPNKCSQYSFTEAYPQAPRQCLNCHTQAAALEELSRRLREGEADVARIWKVEQTKVEEGEQAAGKEEEKDEAKAEDQAPESPDPPNPQQAPFPASESVDPTLLSAFRPSPSLSPAPPLSMSFSLSLSLSPPLQPPTIPTTKLWEAKVRKMAQRWQANLNSSSSSNSNSNSSSSPSSSSSALPVEQTQTSGGGVENVFAGFVDEAGEEGDGGEE